MFPNGWPGRGLLLLRLSSGIALIYQTAVQIRGPQHIVLTGLFAFAAVAGVLLVAGLWTPVAGAVIAALEIATLFCGTDHPERALLSAAVTLSIAMLGPGAWSVDAVLFGRQRLEFPRE